MTRQARTPAASERRHVAGLALSMQSDALFPLTPALSPGEREKLSTASQCLLNGERLPALPIVLPLPKGEGWGEGERRILKYSYGLDRSNRVCRQDVGAPIRRRFVNGLSGLCAALFLAANLLTATGSPVMRVVRTAHSGTPLLLNGSFEELEQGKAAAWYGWQQGYRLAPGEGRSGSQGVVCERREGEGEFGASQALALSRTNIAPFIIRGWSKAEKVSGSPDNGYSLYVDIIYADGTPLWGQTMSFSCGTHDWEQRQFVLLPDKPVKSLTLHCLFRGHTGKVWFDDASVEEVPTPAGALMFQGATLQDFAQARP
jgi:hypothetical protein